MQDCAEAVLALEPSFSSTLIGWTQQSKEARDLYVTLCTMHDAG